MVAFCCQLGKIYSHHGNIPLGVSRTVFPERHKGTGKTHIYFRQHSARGLGSLRKQSEDHHPLLPLLRGSRCNMASWSCSLHLPPRGPQKTLYCLSCSHQIFYHNHQKSRDHRPSVMWSLQYLSIEACTCSSQVDSTGQPTPCHQPWQWGMVGMDLLQGAFTTRWTLFPGGMAA